MAHQCPAEGVSSAMRKCPFLHNIAQTHGEDYANSLLGKPACPFGHRAGQQALLPEDYDANFGATFSLFHGKNGVMPLPHLSSPAPQVLYPAEGQAMGRPCAASSSTEASRSAPLLAGAPFASMSLSWGSNWFNIHHLLQQHLQQHRAQHRKPPQQPQPQHPSPNASGGAVGPGPFSGPGGPSPSIHHTGHGAGTGGGKCPLRRALGPLAGVVFNKHGHLACPEPIVKMRAALAATRPVRELRPQALPIKLLAVAMTTAALNVPCGMWREHTEKFSSQWFVAVHATIPFIAMLRKAVIMPKYAILFTICAAIAGQAMGAKLERKRLLAAAKDEIAGLAKASAVMGPAAPAPVQAASQAPPQAACRRPAAATAAAPRAPPGGELVALPVASLLMAARQGPAAGSGLGTWMAAEEECLAASLGAEEEQRQSLRFRGRAGGEKRGAVGPLLLGGLGAPSAPVIAMLPVTC